MKELSTEDVRHIYDEILKRYRVTFSDYQEERKDGEVKFVHLTLKFKISKMETETDKSAMPEPLAAKQR